MSPARLDVNKFWYYITSFVLMVARTKTLFVKSRPHKDPRAEQPLVAIVVRLKLYRKALQLGGKPGHKEQRKQGELNYGIGKDVVVHPRVRCRLVLLMEQAKTLR